MKERPILFSAPMVRAILAGTKTQTRRVVKKPPPLRAEYCSADKDGHHSFLYDEEDGLATRWLRCPYGQPGDRLWVRETFADLLGTGIEHRPVIGGPIQRYAFAADSPPGSASDEARKDFGVKWKPSIHMPRAACRIELEITDVRVERLQAMTVADAVGEGMHPNEWLRGDDDLMVGEVMHALASPGRFMDPTAPIARFVLLWDSINGKQPGVTNWNANPWVWVVSFKRVAP